MHGRLKVKSTAEQLEAKRKEREKKLKLYSGATSRIFSKKQNGELDEELLQLCGEVLAVNPDFYTLWNYRKEVSLKLQQSKSSSELRNLFVSELFFLETCLKMNPKSYGTWHHRCFVMDTMPDPDWGRELELCNQFLKYDERNFHCWDYRRFVVKRANVPAQAELDFSMSKISNNFSNYSSWHYRSKLLPVIHPDLSQPMGVSEEALLKEYELVQNGFFTDPDDQSNWFYHRWLMGRGDQKQRINSVNISLSDQTVTVSFLKHIQVGKSAEILLECDGSRVEDVCWLNQDQKKTHSTLWIAKDVSLPKDSSFTLDVRLVVGGSEVCSSRLCVKAGDTDPSTRWLPVGPTSRFSQELSAVKTDTLQQELESVTQLIEVETDNKWAVLTAVLLMKALDPDKNNSEIMQNLDKLEALDLKRAEYYKDLRSKFIVESAIDEMDQRDKQPSSSSTSSSPLSSATLSLPGQGLTKLYHPELLALVTSADLSDNCLRDVRHFGHLQSLRELRLGSNQIADCRGLEHLPLLETLDLANNLISSPDSLSALQTCPRLKRVDLTGNPVVEQDTLMEGVRELLPGVEIVTEKGS